jgi:hypothetical protein
MFIDVTVCAAIQSLRNIGSLVWLPDSISGSKAALSFNKVLFAFQNARQSRSCVDFSIPPIYNSSRLLRVSEPLRVHFDVILLCSYPQRQMKKGFSARTLSGNVNWTRSTLTSDRD